MMLPEILRTDEAQILSFCRRSLHPLSALPAAGYRYAKHQPDLFPLMQNISQGSSRRQGILFVKQSILHKGGTFP